ncbi:unannotated protein [freshwater metagenome]|uniref:Unannotated protein n=1 Tax=freshwater metagenome TaxID=449393 RepID=A0A6J7E7H6_9ZZZZ
MVGLGFLQRNLGALELGVPRAATVGVGQDRLDRAAVLALEAFKQRKTLLERVERGGIAFEPLGVAPQLSRQVIGLVGQCGPALRNRVEPRVDAGDAVEPCPACSEQRGDTRTLIRSHRLRTPPRGRAQGLQMAKALARREQLCLLLRIWGGVVDLRHLKGEEVKLSLTRTGESVEFLKAPLGGAHLRVGGRAGSTTDGLLGPAERIEQLELRRGERQPPVLMLPVEREQQLGDLAQIGGGRRPATDQRTGSSLSADPPCEDELLSVGRKTVAEQLAQLLRKIEDTLDVGLLRTGAHDSRASLASKQKVERVREDRLPSTGLAGQDVETGRKLHLGMLDQQQILNAKLVKHQPSEPAQADRPQARPQSGRYDDASWPNFSRSRA